MSFLKQENFFNRDIFILFFCFLIGLEYFIFLTHVQTSVAVFPPGGYDQVQYLLESYRFYEGMSSKHFVQGLFRFFSEGFPVQGIFLQLQAGLLYFIFGVSRAVALSVNFFYFALFQAAVLFGLCKLFKNWTIGWIALGAVLAIESTYAGAGGLTDFRLDFAAACWFGCFMILVLQSKTFLSKKYTIALTLMAIYMYFLRSIFFVHVNGILALFFLCLLAQLKLRPQFKRRTKQPLKNLLKVFSISFAVFVPYLILNWQAFYNYYGVGHVLGDENKIRAAEAGVFNWVGRLTYYFDVVYSRQLGSHLFLCLVLSVIVLLRVQKIKPRLKFSNRVLFLLCSFIAPWIILTADTTKSMIAGNVLGVSTLLFFITLLNKSLNQSRAVLKKIVLLLFIISGAAAFAKAHLPRQQAHHIDLAQTRLLYQDIAAFCANKNQKKFVLSSNQVSEYASPGPLRIFIYEQTGRIIPIYGNKLGETIFEVSQNQAKQALDESDIFIFYHLEKNVQTPYPFYQSMQQLKPFIQAELAQNFVLYKTYFYPYSKTQVEFYIKQ